MVLNSQEMLNYFSYFCNFDTKYIPSWSIFEEFNFLSYLVPSCPGFYCSQSFIIFFQVPFLLKAVLCRLFHRDTTPQYET